MFDRNRRVFSTIAFAVTLVVGALFAGATQPSRADDKSADLDKVRAALEKYQDPYTAIREGYLSTVACVDFQKGGMIGDMPYPAGAMGVHFLNKANVGPTVDPSKPQVLIYEPVGDKLRLAAAEWFVPLATGVKERPTLFGHPFYGPMMGHQPIMPAGLTHYDLHVWLWKTNPAGMFKPTNPAVKCPTDGYTVHAADMGMKMNQ